MLSQYNPKTALYFGNRFAVEGVDEGYMAGNLRNIIYYQKVHKYIYCRRRLHTLEKSINQIFRETNNESYTLSN